MDSQLLSCEGSLLIYIYINIRCDCISLSRGFLLFSVGGSRRNFLWTISETWLSWEEHLFFFASFLCEENTNNLQPRICGRSAVWCRAMPSERENHFSSRLTCNLSFLSSFHCVFLSRLFCQSVCGLYFVFSPSPWYFVLSSFESNFVLWFFFYDFKAWGFYKPDKRILCEMCCTESFGLNRKLSDVIGRPGLFYVILNLNWYFYYASAALWASVLCTISRPASPEQKTLLHWHPMATRAGRLYIEYSWYFCTQLFECAFLSLTSLMVVLQYQNQDLCLIHIHESLQTVFFNESP